jgi:hypothetical protein
MVAACGKLAVAVTATVVAFASNSKAQPACSYDSVDFSSLRSYSEATDYKVTSKFYSSYEFAFNICAQLNWISGSCVAGAGVCERLISSEQATDVYGYWNSQVYWVKDANDEYMPDVPYLKLSGQTCMFGGDMESRIGLKCDTTATTPYLTVVHESYYDCQSFILVESSQACAGAPPGPSPGPPAPNPSPSPSPPSPNPNPQTGGSGDVGDVGAVMCWLFFAFSVVYFAGGAAINYKKGETGQAMVPHSDFWLEIPGLVKDGFSLSYEKIKGCCSKGDDYTELK